MQKANKHTDNEVVLSKKEYDKMISERDKLTSELGELKRQLAELNRMIFGSKSERFVPIDSKQLQLFEDMLAQKEEELEKHTIVYQREKAKKKKEKPVRTVIPAHFPRVDEIIEPDNIDPNAVKIGEEITELLEIRPMKIFVRRIIRPKYSLPNDQGIVIADLPSVPIPKGKVSASLLAFILISKFVDHLPLYRLLQIFKRQELVISKSTIGGWVSKTSELLQPLYDSFKEKFLEDADYIQADESPIKVQDKEKRKTTHRGFMWVYRNPVENLILFDYHKGRGKNVPEIFFQNYTGTLQSDGYKVYKNLKTKGDNTLLGCMAHARRYFEKALDNDPKRADHVLLLIQKLYAIERKLKEDKKSTAEIKDYRIQYALPILNEIEDYLKTEKENTLPKSSISVAINYTLNIFDHLKEYINDGKFEIDNNNIENAIRPLAIGRKNYLFAGSHESAQNIAMFYSFFASCKTHNINPHTWLCDVLDRIPEHKANKIQELLPHNWKPMNEEV
jgi:transposase